MTVNLTRIYTKLGDGGETHLGDMSRVSKTDARVEAYGTVDELNAQLGVLLARDDLPDGWPDWLRRVQNDLFDIGADVSTPAGGDRERLRLAAAQTEWLEARCDEVNATLEPRRRGHHHRGRPLPQPALGPAVHPRPGGQPRRRTPLGTRSEPMSARAVSTEY
jgi:cob(I)alamin adenosyltransferase